MIKRIHSFNSSLESVHFKESYPCNICGYQATEKGFLTRHIKNVHQNSENIDCSECNKSIQKISLKRHMKMLHSGEQTLYYCKICTYQSKYQFAVNKHVQNVHQKL